jgi:hypothetical protein
LQEVQANQAKLINPSQSIQAKPSQIKLSQVKTRQGKHCFSFCADWLGWKSSLSKNGLCTVYGNVMHSTCNWCAKVALAAAGAC